MCAVSIYVKFVVNESAALLVMILLSHCESYPGLDRRGRRDGGPGDEDRHGGDEQQDDGAHGSI